MPDNSSGYCLTENDLSTIASLTFVPAKTLTQDEIISKLQAELKGLGFEMTKFATISQTSEEEF